MRATFLLLSIVLFLFSSCKKCDCEKDCPSVIVSSKENTIMVEELYGTYLSYHKREKEKKKKFLIKRIHKDENKVNYSKLIGKKDRLKLKELDNDINKLKSTAVMSKIDIEDDNPCIICPNNTECCNLETVKYILHDLKFKRVNLYYDEDKVIKLENGKLLIPVKSLNGFDSKTKTLKLDLTGFDKKPAYMNFQFQ